MKRIPALFVLMALLALLLFPWQSARAFDNPPPDNGRVIVGSSYTLKNGETLTDRLVVVGGSASLEAGSTLHGDLVVVCGSATLAKDAKIDGAVVIVGGGLILDTAIGGDVVVIGGPAKLQENAHVRGSLVTIGGTVQKADGARVDGDTVENVSPPISPTLPGDPAAPVVPQSDFSKPASFLMEAVKIVLNAVLLAALAALIALFLPAQLRRVGKTVTYQPLMAGGMGILTYVLFVVTVVALALFSVLIITLILTVPLLLVVILALVAGSVFGWLAIGTEAGERLAALSKREWPLAASAALGTFVLTLVTNSVATVPCVSWMLKVVVGLMGLGAVLMTRFGTQNAALTAAQPAIMVDSAALPPSAGE